MIFDERLTELRKGLGVTQRNFALELDIEPSKYNKWENGKTVPDFDTVIKLANYFEVSVDYLVGNSDAKKSEDEKVIADLGLTNKSIETIKKMKTRFAQTKIKGSLFPDDERSQLDVFNALLSNNKFTQLMDSLQIVSYPTGWTATWWEDGEPNIFTIDSNKAMLDAHRKLVELTLDIIIDAIKEEIANNKIPKEQIINAIKKER